VPLFRFVGAINLVSVLLVLVVFGGAAHLARRSLPRFLVFLRVRSGNKDRVAVEPVSHYIPAR
jgi:hypothetical protein